MNNFKQIISDIKTGKAHSLEYLLSHEVEDTLSKKGIRIRKLFAPLLRKAYSTQYEYKLVVDKKEPLEKTKKGKIYLVNHRQSDDLLFAAATMGKSGYFVFGNRKLALESSTIGFGLWGYGMILLDRDDKESRKSTYEKMKYVLNNGENVIIFPEGYWNLDDNGQKDEFHLADDHNSENWIIQDFNVGALRLAQETGCECVPITIHYDDYNKKNCYTRQGKAFKIGKDDDVFAKKDEIIEYMRTETWEMMEKYSDYKREEVEKVKSLKIQWEELKAKLIEGACIPSAGYVLDLKDEKRIGKAKVVNGVTTNEEAFEHLDKIDYNQSNAYLLSKKYTGRK